MWKGWREGTQGKTENKRKEINGMKYKKRYKRRRAEEQKRKKISSSGELWETR